MGFTAIVSRRVKSPRRAQADRRRQERVNHTSDRRKSGGRRLDDSDMDGFAYHGT